MLLRDHPDLRRPLHVDVGGQGLAAEPGEAGDVVALGQGEEAGGALKGDQFDYLSSLVLHHVNKSEHSK